ncbi:hypothetical protein [Ellagibacter isourolithinifaciens]|uniref:hypothetical protein n=1 Tax=Ellagibacter isourolithinifaciens TaxID=2137581 RepID=UPI003A8E40A5
MKNGIVTLAYGKIAHLDATTGPTDWAGRSIELERKMGMEGHAPAPPSESRRPGQIEAGYEIDATTGATVDATTGATVDATSGATRSFSHDNDRESAAEAHGDAHKGEECEADTVDATTGATPGVSAACKELGMASLSDVIADMGIKPPGQV